MLSTSLPCCLPDLLLFSRSAGLSTDVCLRLLKDAPPLQRSCTEDGKTRYDQPDLEHLPQRLIISFEGRLP
jgi:hypothetical protein